MLLVLRMVEERFHRDVEDRPIREGRTPREHLRDGEIEYKTCPYSGSRYLHGNPMNVSALRQTGAHWDEILDALGVLRTAYVSARGGPADDVMDVWRTSQLGSALPWFYILRGEPCPAFAAALSKATLGVGIWAQWTLVRGLVEQRVSPPLTAAAILASAEASGTLIGRSEVCSGSDKMLLPFFEALVAPPGTARAAFDVERALALGAHYQALKLLLWIHHLARRFVAADIAAHRADYASEAHAILDAPVAPPDFFLIEPPEMAALPPARRLHWFAGLAILLVAFSPARDDTTYRELARRIAVAMSEGAPPADTFRMLDDILGSILGAVEAGFRRALGAGGEVDAIDVAARDRIAGASLRSLIASLG